MAARTRVRVRTAVAGAALALLLTACGSGSGDSAPFQGGGSAHSADPGAPGPAAKNGNGTTTQAAPAAVPDAAARAEKWGLKPFAVPPAAPAVKPIKANPAAPPVVKQIPTDQKVVFVTLDDGAEKDPKFLDLMRDMNIPVTMFLNDTYIKQNPDYFRQLQAMGNSIQNHTVDHPNLKTLDAAAQKREICDDSDRIATAYGTRPRLFRPPFGNYNPATLTATGQCGMGAVVLWKESMQINDMQYAEGKQLKPGDIILAHFRGPSELKGTTMTQMMVNLFRKIQDQGFTIARLDDYIG
ncbi:polysaccharide deacetylase family protein [Yinghuangia seranimata]|uniref:polysaccharide deacetylase family protein n=1 Tax=Yinghuangia seranimata TaxID=408067 RepID=UPI00248D1D71|nr:polysaccharide deacetylase family protein [Yinghuangia seranimata]MDI2126838.1 polysaccharide deacetylase family protein [Yinghuangia seranimata]